jgi:hypothetical protein
MKWSKNMNKSYFWFIIGAVAYTFFIFMAGFMTSHLNNGVNNNINSQNLPLISKTMKENITSFAAGAAQTVVGDFAQKMLSRSSK